MSFKRYFKRDRPWSWMKLHWTDTGERPWWWCLTLAAFFGVTGLTAFYRGDCSGCVFFLVGAGINIGLMMGMRDV